MNVIRSVAPLLPDQLFLSWDWPAKATGVSDTSAQEHNSATY